MLGMGKKREEIFWDEGWENFNNFFEKVEMCRNIKDYQIYVNSTVQLNMISNINCSVIWMRVLPTYTLEFCSKNPGCKWFYNFCSFINSMHIVNPDVATVMFVWQTLIMVFVIQDHPDIRTLLIVLWEYIIVLCTAKLQMIFFPFL